MADLEDAAERRRTARMMYDFLSQAPVLLPLATPQPGGGSAVQVPESPAALENIMISFDAKSAHSAMLMFLDEASLQKKFPGCRYVSVPARKALEIFVASRYDSLFFNPAGQWSSCTRPQAAEFLDAGRL
jgi:hypothetical protein